MFGVGFASGVASDKRPEFANLRGLTAGDWEFGRILRSQRSLVTVLLVVVLLSIVVGSRRVRSPIVELCLEKYLLRHLHRYYIS